MSSKKSLITSIIVVVIILVAGGLLWKGGFLGQKFGRMSDSVFPTGGEPGIMGETGGQTTGETGSVGKMTDDIYVDMMIKIVAIQAEKNPATYATSVANLYKKYGITEESMAAYAKELEKDPTRAMNIAQKYSQELQKLQGISQ